MLPGEIHHRVKNNLQVVPLLNLQSSMISDPAVKSMLMDSQNRIQSMALIHQTLYQSNDFASVDFSGFLDVLIPTLVTTYGFSDNKNRPESQCRAGQFADQFSHSLWVVNQ